MLSYQRPVVAGVDGSPSSDAVLRWAIADARTQNVPLRLVFAFEWNYTHSRVPLYSDVPEEYVQLPRHVAEQAVAELVGRATELGDVDVAGKALDGEPVSVLLEESLSASQLVLGSRLLKALRSSVLGSVSAGVAARAACPVVVLRGPAGLPDEGTGVVVGVDGSPRSQLVLEYGFDYASRHQLPLRAVLCWYPDLLAVMSWRPEPPPPERVDAWLAETLAGWQQKFPDVAVHPEVIREHPTAGLVLASAEQRVLVVGSHGHRALVGTMLGSTSQGVLHHASCPVAVVPTRYVL
jgi:nucleotide-binding universal stress UspA family protein